MEEVRDLLNGIGLGLYADKFEEEGWDDIDTVLSMTQDEIRTCIDKPGHVKKLWLKLQRMIIDQGLQEKFDFTAKTKEDDNNTGNTVTQMVEPPTEKHDNPEQLHSCSVNVQDLGHDELCQRVDENTDAAVVKSDIYKLSEAPDIAAIGGDVKIKCGATCMSKSQGGDDKVPDSDVHWRQSCSSESREETFDLKNGPQRKVQTEQTSDATRLKTDEVSSESLLKNNSKDNSKPLALCLAQEIPRSVVNDGGSASTVRVSNEESILTELPHLPRKAFQHMRRHIPESDPASTIVRKDVTYNENDSASKNITLDKRLDKTTEHSGPTEATASTSQEETRHLELLPYNILNDNNGNMALVGTLGLSGTAEVRAVINNQGKGITRLRTNTLKPAQCTVVENSENVTIAENVEIHHHKIREPKYKHRITTILENIKKRHEDLHVTTNALKEAGYILEDRYWVLIAGNPGDGKTWMGHQLLLDHWSNGYEPLIVTSTDDWKEMVGGKESRKQIAFIDDFFGSVNLDDRKVSDWMSLLEDTETLLKERKGELLVVCTTRKIIWAEVSSKLKKFKSFEAMRLLDLSLYKLDKKEKMELLCNYGSHFVVDINSGFIDHQTQSTHGFPHCVEMYCTNQYLRKHGEQHFFSSPLQFLEEDIINLYKSHSNKFCALVTLLITKNTGQKMCIYDFPEELESVIRKASCCCLVDKIPSFGVIKESIQQLNGVYIEQDESGNVKLKHPSFSEIISLLITREHPKFALDILDLEFLIHKTKCCNYTQSSIEDVAMLPNVCFEQLAKRLTNEVMGSSNALQHDAFTNTDFVNVWLKYVSGTRFDDTSTIVEHLMTMEYSNFDWVWFLPRFDPFLCKVPVSAVDILFPALIRCEILQKYWGTDDGNVHISRALVQASYMNRSTSVLGSLLDAGANIDFVSRVNFGIFTNALCSAVARKNIANIKLLLSHGACPFTSLFVSELDENVLCLAYQAEDNRIIKLIKECMAMHESRHQDIFKGRRFVQHCLFGEKYITIMHSRATEDMFNIFLDRPHERIGCTQRLLEIGLDINSKHTDKGRSVLHTLVVESQSEYCHFGGIFSRIRQLLDAGADANIADKHGNVPLFDALRYSLDSRMLTLLVTNTNVAVRRNKKGLNAFHFLFLAKRIAPPIIRQLTEVLLKAGCKINQVDHQRRAPIALATYTTIEMVLEHRTIFGIDCSAAPDLPLRLIRLNMKNVVTKLSFLLDIGFTTTAKDTRKRNIVHIVAMSGYEGLVKVQLLRFILKAGKVDVNARDIHGITPLMLACKKRPIDEQFINFLLDNGAQIEDTDKRGLTSLHYCIERGADLKIFLGKEIIISDETIEYAILNVKDASQLVDVVKIGKIRFERVLGILEATMSKQQEVDKRDSLFAILMAYGDILEIVHRSKRVRRLILMSVSCFTNFLQEGLDVHVLTDQGIPLSWLPKEDGEASCLIEELVKYGGDVEHILTTAEGKGCIETKLAKHGYIKTLMTVLKNRNSRFDIQNEECAKEILLNVLSSLDDDLLIANILDHLLHSEAIQKCLSEMAPSYLNCCVNRVPFKIHCARLIFPHVEQVLFECAEYSGLLHTAVEALNIHVLISNTTGASGNLKAEEDGSLDNNLLSLIHLLQKNNMPTNIQDIEGRTPLMVILSFRYTGSLLKSVRELIDQAKGLPETDVQGRNILHYLTRSDLAASSKYFMIQLVLQKGATIRPDCFGRRAVDDLPSLQLNSFLEILRLDENKRLYIDTLTHTINELGNDKTASEVLKTIIKMISSNVNDISDITGVTLLAHASRALNVKLVTYLLGEEADTNKPDIIGQTALHKLFSSECLISLKWITKCFFTPDFNQSNEYMEIFMAIVSRVSFCFDYLRTLRRTEPYSPASIHRLILDSVNDALHVLFLLLEAGADPNQMDHTGRSPLHHCVGAYIPDAFVCPAIKMLLAYGAEVNMEDYDGVTPLMICVQYVHTKYRRMNILIAAGADAAATDYLQNGLPYYSNLGVKNRVAVKSMDYRECLTVYENVVKSLNGSMEQQMTANKYVI